ncbi:hypothetical protein COLO4_37653 [Corchorus olitorius]|uniref:Uncharacterized protein n=1 Tax=Corchorus olitorius TaxID=93759 RepID=A0A1R3G078_9ROSI|nr:hypothetical protein COLO4_37653 [Corchorus olitorius]
MALHTKVSYSLHQARMPQKKEGSKGEQHYYDKMHSMQNQ